jgi:ubiquinone/menaquinone biosynthesis C-methylase UbiE
VNTSEAVALIEGAVRGHEGTWADLGAGDGTFTRALGKLLGPKSRIYAVDREASAVAELERWSASAAENVIPVQADFTGAFELPLLGETLLDGMFLANALHFVRDAGAVLTRLVKLVRPGGRVVLVEYDQREASRWVPHPIPIAHLPALAAAAGISAPTVTATRPSTYRGTLYVAAADRLGLPDVNERAP